MRWRKRSSDSQRQRVRWAPSSHRARPEKGPRRGCRSSPSTWGQAWRLRLHSGTERAEPGTMTRRTSAFEEGTCSRLRVRGAARGSRAMTSFFVGFLTGGWRPPFSPAGRRDRLLPGDDEDADGDRHGSGRRRAGDADRAPLGLLDRALIESVPPRGDRRRARSRGRARLRPGLEQRLPSGPHPRALVARASRLGADRVLAEEPGKRSSPGGAVPNPIDRGRSPHRDSGDLRLSARGSAGNWRREIKVEQEAR